MAQQQPIATGRLTLDDAAVQDFTASLRGEVLRPTDEVYDETRKIHNGMIDRRPTLIVRCAGGRRRHRLRQLRARSAASTLRPRRRP